MHSPPKTAKLRAVANVCSAASIAKDLEKICTSVKSCPATAGTCMIKDKNPKLISRSPAADLNLQLHMQRPRRPFLACLTNHRTHRHSNKKLAIHAKRCSIGLLQTSKPSVHTAERVKRNCNIEVGNLLWENWYKHFGYSVLQTTIFFLTNVAISPSLRYGCIGFGTLTQCLP